MRTQILTHGRDRPRVRRTHAGVRRTGTAEETAVRVVGIQQLSGALDLERILEVEVPVIDGAGEPARLEDHAGVEHGGAFRVQIRIADDVDRAIRVRLRNVLQVRVDAGQVRLRRTAEGGLERSAQRQPAERLPLDREFRIDRRTHVAAVVFVPDRSLHVDRIGDRQRQFGERGVDGTARIRVVTRHAEGDQSVLRSAVRTQLVCRREPERDRERIGPGARVLRPVRDVAELGLVLFVPRLHAAGPTDVSAPQLDVELLVEHGVPHQQFVDLASRSFQRQPVDQVLGVRNRRNKGRVARTLHCGISDRFRERIEPLTRSLSCSRRGRIGATGRDSRRHRDRSAQTPCPAPACRNRCSCGCDCEYETPRL